jgi:hypothetical protein
VTSQLAAVQKLNIRDVYIRLAASPGHQRLDCSDKSYGCHCIILWCSGWHQMGCVVQSLQPHARHHCQCCTVANTCMCCAACTLCAVLRRCQLLRIAFRGAAASTAPGCLLDTTIQEG